MAPRVEAFFPEKLTNAAKRLAEILRENNKPVLTSYDFHHLVWEMYRQPDRKKLYLRRETPAAEDTNRLRTSLRKAGIIGSDPDYGAKVIRVLSIPDLPADDIVCMLDSTCYVSHLSSMQRWGLTDRHPEKLILSRPDRTIAQERLKEKMEIARSAGEEVLFPLRIVAHPHVVRQRNIMVFETKAAGASLQSRGTNVRVATIGQTFLDMVQKPDLCGGMSHVLDVWQEHAKTYLDEIVAAVDTAKSDIAKSRAGYILDERLRLHHPQIELWKALSQRGGSRKLDPDKDFSPLYSEVWMLSLNV